MEVSNELVLTIEHKLQQALYPKRYVHTLGVAYLSASLAMCHGTSHRDALIAGLLHDCAKNHPEDFMLSECLRLNIELSECEKQIPELIHAPYGSYLAQTEYGIHQDDILLAIRNHTLGRPNMTPIEQIVYLADYFEPERTHQTSPSLDEIRKIAFQNLDMATYLVSKNSIHYFETTGKNADPMTYRVFEYYKDKIQKGE
ncbi:MAG: bis(5'-nucleosyl)-tetraphosphatase (symmetrical) YqeK [Lachnospiraceae bacterium]|nr:bis(5'-nucleosyl)-tetraphosphatase (symmetrical) YqeK [Lachnospiraceae bacterium]MBQ8785732.1 bis(5'-nucleosyl)-tetraphosphatase (symmetrical) YqeK [Alphaproteobacteria bacterium]